jgi:hypothetical protein
VAAAARTAALLNPKRDRLAVSTVEFVRGDLILWTASGSRIVWGRPPREETDREPTAAQKCERLLESLEAVRQSPLPVEIDLRPASGAMRRLLFAASGGSARVRP